MSLEELVQSLVKVNDSFPNTDMVQQMVITLTKLVEMDADRLDMKILATTLRELRYAFKIFAPYRKNRKVSIFGSARTGEEDPDYKMAFKIGEALAKNDFMVITGAGDGIMKAAQGGAGAEKGFGVNIMLPFEQSANLFIEKDPKLVTFKYFFTRKLIFIKETDGVILFPGGFGTHDEGFETLTLLQTGKRDPLPVVLVENPNRPYWTKWKEFLENCLLDRGLISQDDLHLFKIVTGVDDAVKEITSFYKNYHSLQYIREQLVIRVNHSVQKSLLGHLNKEFKDIIVEGNIERTSAFPEEEINSPGLNELDRIVFKFNRRHFGRLRQLVDTLNRY
ncbi:MAG: TIGR00730 family Rossman fold protein [Nitrospirae bacterium]|nr:TIGR00730 family Rossman fold protein [Nitrospirota bacterium]MBI3595023.1 TIGR00730 family Rossman fold protein [Nitrospirota bacterium]